MLSSKQKRYLKSEVMTMHALYQIGKEGLGTHFFEMIDKALDANELLKIRVLNTVNTPIREIALDLSAKLNAEIVQIVGKVITLYRDSKHHIYTEGLKK